MPSRSGLATLLALAALTPVTAATADVEEARVPTALAAGVGALREVGSFSIGAQDVCGDARTGITAGAGLWRTVRTDVQRARARAASDDRPLYWQRLAALAEHRTRCVAQQAPRDAFERASRGLDDVLFSADAALRVLVTGFDPFFLDRDIAQSNPSGVAALAVDELTTTIRGQRVEIQSVVVPVRYQDFDDGLVERDIVPVAIRNQVDLLITVSMGRDDFDLERFPGRRRSAEAPDNRNVFTGASADDPRVPELDGEPLAGPEFVEFTLPADAMTRGEGRWAVHDNRTVTTLERGTIDATSLDELADQTAVRGGGGGYLSNEISFRVLNALNTQGAAHIRSGHIHTPRLRGHDGATVTAIADQTQALILRAAGSLLDEAH